MPIVSKKNIPTLPETILKELERKLFHIYIPFESDSFDFFFL